MFFSLSAVCLCYMHSTLRIQACLILYISPILVKTSREDKTISAIFLIQCTSMKRLHEHNNVNRIYVLFDNCLNQLSYFGCWNTQGDVKQSVWGHEKNTQFLPCLNNAPCWIYIKNKNGPCWMIHSVKSSWEFSTKAQTGMEALRWVIIEVPHISNKQAQHAFGVTQCKVSVLLSCFLQRKQVKYKV